MSIDQTFRLRRLAINSQFAATLKTLFGEQRTQSTTGNPSTGEQPHEDQPAESDDISSTESPERTDNPNQESAQSDSNPVVSQAEERRPSLLDPLFQNELYERYDEIVIRLSTEPKLSMADISEIRGTPLTTEAYSSHSHRYKALLTLHTILTPSQVPPRHRQAGNNITTVLGDHQQILPLYQGRKRPRQLEIQIHDEFNPNTSCSFSPQILSQYLDLINPPDQAANARVSHLMLIGAQAAIKRFLESPYGEPIKSRYQRHSYLLQIKSRPSTFQPAKGWLRNLKGAPNQLSQLAKSLQSVLKLTPAWCEGDLRFDRSSIVDKLSGRFASIQIDENKRTLTVLSRLRPHWPHPYAFPVYENLANLIHQSQLHKTCPEAAAAAEAAMALHHLRFFDPEKPEHAPLARIIQHFHLITGQDPRALFYHEFNERAQEWLQSYTAHYQTLIDALKPHIQNHFFSMAGFIAPLPSVPRELTNTESPDTHPTENTPIKIELDPDFTSHNHSLKALTELWQRLYQKAQRYIESHSANSTQACRIQFPQLHVITQLKNARTYLLTRDLEDIQLPFSPAFAPPLPPEDADRTNQPAPQNPTPEQPDQHHAPLVINLSETLKPQFQHPWTDAQLAIDDTTAIEFNPAFDKPTALREATLTRPVLEKAGLQHSAKILGNLGYALRYSEQNEKRLLRKARKQQRALLPLYGLTKYERNAFYLYGPAEAQTTVINPNTNEVIWQQGKKYQITPSWERTVTTIDTENEPETLPANAREIVPAGHDLNSVSYNLTTTRSVEYGYAVFLVTTESGEPLKIKEIYTVEEQASEKERISERLGTLQEQLDNLIRVRQENLAVSQTLTAVATPGVTQAIHITNEAIDHFNKQIETANNELQQYNVTIDTFNEAFPPPTPPLASEIFEQEIRHKLSTIRKRFSPYYAELKDYQLRVAALSAIKPATANGSCMGAGKTLMTIMSAWSKSSQYVLVIAPTKAMKTWAEELDRCGLYHELIGYQNTPDKGWQKNPKENGISHIRRLNKRMVRHERQTNRLGLIEPEFYIVSSELLSLGDQSNQRYDLWHADYPLTTELTRKLDDAQVTLPLNRWQILSLEENDPNNQLSAAETRRLNDARQILRIWSDRVDNQQEIKQAGAYGLIPVKTFSSAIGSCPVCQAEPPLWLTTGTCRACGHHHRSHRRDKKTVRTTKMMTMRELRARGIYTTAPLPSNFCFTSTKNSTHQYPAYKLLPKQFGTKIIDEVHTQAGFNTLHGRAIQNIRTNHTFALSGTLCRTYITEIEPLLCLLHPLQSGQFPHAPWNMDHFREQFSTQEKENIRHTYQQNGLEIPTESTRARGRNIRKTVPEASNLPTLRRFIHGVHVFAEEHEIAASWDLAKPRERLIPVTLHPKSKEEQDQWISELRSLYETQLRPAPIRQTHLELSSSGLDHAAGHNSHHSLFPAATAPTAPLHYSRAVQRQIDHYFERIRLIADGPEKLDALVAWTKEQNAAGHRCVLVGCRRQFYKLICKRMEQENIRFMTLNEQTTPENRHEVLNHFRDSNIPNLLSRTQLINTNYNQLTCCNRGLFWGMHPSPSAMEQMKYRLSRPGQTNRDIEWGTLITVDPEGTSYEQAFYNILGRKRQAIRETLKSVDRPRTLEEVVRQNEERQLQNQLLEEILKETAQQSPVHA